MTNFEGEISGVKIELEPTLDPIVCNRLSLETPQTDQAKL